VEENHQAAEPQATQADRILLNNRIRMRLARIPIVLIALMLLIPIYLIDLFDVLDSISWLPSWLEGFISHWSFWAVLFLAGAVKRWNWRHALSMVAILTVYIGLTILIGRFNLEAIS